MRRLALSLALVLATSVALGQPRDAPAAEVLFREGRAAFDRGDFATARSRFGESQRLDPAAGTLLNLAMAEARLGDVTRAWEHAKAAVDSLPPGDDRIAIARGLYDELDRRVPRLRVVLAAGAPPGTRVVRDDVELREGSLGVALPIDPGEHVLRVVAPGRDERRIPVSAHEGATIDLAVEPGPATAAPPPVSHEPAPARGTPVLGWSLLGAGVVGLGVGTFAGLKVLSKKNDVDAHCDAARVCDDTAFEAASQGKSWSTVSTVSFAAGAVLAGAGVYLVLSYGKSGQVAGALHPGGASATLRF
jgi:hypothetical protein